MEKIKGGKCGNKFDMYYRISRRQKKSEKTRLVRLTRADMLRAGMNVKNITVKNLAYMRMIMLGVIYHKFEWRK